VRLGSLAERVARFYTVGAAGIVVQLVTLAMLGDLFRLHYLAATALAVEIALLHNFLWHERWTWADRTRRRNGTGPILARLVRFNLTTGAISIAGNLLFMRLLAGWLGIHYLAANLLSIAACSVLNFLASELVVFRIRRARGG